MIEVPDVVANKARAIGAEAWLGGLAALVADLESEWGITVGRPYPGGTEAWVAEAVDDRGWPVVLKLCLPRGSDDPWRAARQEAIVLGRAGGRGCALLHRADTERGALLLERLGPSLADLQLPFRRRLEILCRVATELWTSPDGLDLPTGADKARSLIDHIEVAWLELDRPCTEAAVVAARRAGRRRVVAADPERSVLAHGDVHQWNTLRAEPAGRGPSSWKLIDPDGLAIEPEYDLGVLLREDPDEHLLDIEAGDPRRRARWLAERTGCDEDAIWDWGLIERVSTGLLATHIGLQPVGERMLMVADRLAGLS